MMNHRQSYITMKRSLFLVIGIIFLTIILPAILSWQPSPIPTSMNEQTERSRDHLYVPIREGQVLSPSSSILEQYDLWDGQIVVNNQLYRPGATIYFEDEKLDLEILLPTTENLNTTTNDLQRLKEQYIEVQINDPRYADFADYDHLKLYASSSHPSHLRAELQAWYDIQVKFHSRDQDEIYQFSFQRAPSFTYKMTTPFADDHSHWENTTTARTYLPIGRKHVFNVEFSLPVDQDSFSSQMKRLSYLDWNYRWISDTRLTIILDLDEEDLNLMEEYEDIYLGFNGVTSQIGTVLTSDHDLAVRFQPTVMKQYATRSIEGSEIMPLFSTLVEYTSLEFSPNQQWILACELSTVQHVFMTHYSILDRHGNRLKTIEGQQPVWTADGQSLIYRTHNEIVRYDVILGEKHVIWSASETPAILSFRYDSNTDQLLIASGRTQGEMNTIDVTLFHHLDDNDPDYFQDLFQSVDEYTYSGLNYTLPIQFVDEETWIYKNQLKEQNGEWSNEDVIYKWKEDQKRSIQKYVNSWSDAFPLGEGQVLYYYDHKWELLDVQKDGVTTLREGWSEDGQGLVQVDRIAEKKLFIRMSDGQYYILDLEKNGDDAFTSVLIEEGTMLPHLTPQAELVLKRR